MSATVRVDGFMATKKAVRRLRATPPVDYPNTLLEAEAQTDARDTRIHLLGDLAPVHAGGEGNGRRRCRVEHIERVNVETQRALLDLELLGGTQVEGVVGLPRVQERLFHRDGDRRGRRQARATVRIDLRERV